MINSIHHTSFTVSDMDQSIAFYRDLLDMKLEWDSKEAGFSFEGPVHEQVTQCPGTKARIAFMTLGDAMLELVEYTPPGKPLVDNKAGDTGSAHLCFRTDDINELYEKLSANGVELHCSPQNNERAWVFYFRDPDGIILEATQPHATG